MRKQAQRGCDLPKGYVKVSRKGVTSDPLACNLSQLSVDTLSFSSCQGREVLLKKLQEGPSLAGIRPAGQEWQTQLWHHLPDMF